MASLVGITACGGTDWYGGSLPPAQPLGDALALFDRDHASVIIVDPQRGAGPEGRRWVHRVATGEAPAWAMAVPRPDDPANSQILVSDPAGEQVLVLRDKSGRVDALSMGVPFGDVDVSADGAFGIAYQRDGDPLTGALLAFPNTIAVLHLHPDDPTAVTLRLGAGGARPLAARFSSALRLLGPTGPQSVRVAFVFVRGGLVPIDIERGVAAAFVPVTPERDTVVLPAEVLFSDNRGDDVRGEIDFVERAFVRTTDGEVFVLAVALAGSGPGALAVTLENVVTPGTAVSDIELYVDSDGNELLLAAAGTEVILVDGFSGVAQRFPAPSRVDQLVGYVDPTSGDALAFGYSASAPALQLVRIHPQLLAERRSTGLTSLSLGQRVTAVELAPRSARAILRYTEARDLGLLDLGADGQLLDVAFAEAPIAQSLIDEGDHLLVVTGDPSSSEPFLSEVSLADLTTRDVRLDEEARAVGRAGDHLWAQDNTLGGTLTFFPVDDLDRDAGIRLSGLSATRFLEGHDEPQDGGDSP